MIKISLQTGEEGDWCEEIVLKGDGNLAEVYDKIKKALATLEEGNIEVIE